MTTMVGTEKLAFGATRLVPEDAKAAWGARLIVTQDGYVDAVPGRHDLVGESKAALVEHLKRVDPVSLIGDMLRTRQIRVDQAADVTVYEDDQILVRGNSNASHGYFYVCAYLK